MAMTPAQKAAQKKKVNLLGNTSPKERSDAEKRIAANKKKALAKVAPKPKAKARLESSKKGNILTKRIDMINKASK